MQLAENDRVFTARHPSHFGTVVRADDPCRPGQTLVCWDKPSGAPSQVCDWVDSARLSRRTVAA